MSAPTIQWLEVTSSTNDAARLLAVAGEASGSVVVAARQTAGRGRSGHHWETLSGEHVFLTMIHRSRRPAAALTGLTLDAAVAVARTLDTLGATTNLRWPNDILVGPLKLAGVLCELHTDIDPDGPVVLLGVGINANATQTAIPSELHGIATTLEVVLGDPVDVAALIETLIAALRRACDDYERRGAPDLGAWSGHANMLGSMVTLDDGRRGVATGLDADGALLVRLQDSGPTVTVRSGIVATDR